MGLYMYLLLDKGRKGKDEIKRIMHSEEFWGNKWKNREEFDGLFLAKWRKAFGILNWFDHNLESVANQVLPDDDVDREGVQNYQFYKVKKSELDELCEICSDILAVREDEYAVQEIPEDLMPTGDGFFIHAYKNINDWWWHDLEHTVKGIEEANRHIDWDKDDVYFYVSY